MAWLREVFGMDPREEQEIARTIGNVKSVADYASCLTDSLKKSGLTEALRSVSPWWASPVAEAAGESFAVVKFLVKLAEKLPERPSPKQSGLLACTLAFERSAEMALLQAGIPPNRVPMVDAAAEVRSKLTRYRLEDPEILRGFSLDSPAAHPFVSQSLEALKAPMHQLGYSEAEIRRLGSVIRDLFKENLRDVLSAPALREKFAAFVQWAQLGSEEDRAYYALQTHADLQRIAFNESPVLGQEPFALADVYTETDCGELSWKTIRGDGKPEHKIDAFEEKSGGRHALVPLVLKYLGDKTCHEPIIVQGGPGSGKTAFTLQITDELLRAGVTPILIRIRDLRIDLPLLNALSYAITESRDLGLDRGQVPKPSNALLDGAIFNESVQFGNATISRFVLILDGWDEVSTADRGYQIQVKELLQNVRNELVRRSNPLVRVILTGRP
jgi:primosomal protein N'